MNYFVLLKPTFLVSASNMKNKEVLFKSLIEGSTWLDW